MWLNRQDVRESLDRWQKEVMTWRTAAEHWRGRAEGLKAHVASLQSACDWQRLRLNQLELFMSRVLEKQLDLTIPAPQVERAPVAPEEGLIDFVDPEERRLTGETRTFDDGLQQMIDTLPQLADED